MHSMRTMRSWQDSLVLGSRQVQRTWRLLTIIGLGMLIAVTIVCAMPLYTQVAATAGLHNVLKTLPDSSYLTISSPSMRYPDREITNAVSYTHAFDKDVSNLPFVDGKQASFVTTTFPLVLTPSQLAGGTYAMPACSQVELAGYSASQMSPHARLLKGRLPQVNTNALEIAVSPAMATNLRLDIGSILTMRIDYTKLADVASNAALAFPRQIALQVVGIFAADSVNDPFWHGVNFDPVLVPRVGQDARYVYCKPLVSVEGFFAALQRLQQLSEPRGFSPTMELDGDWYYHLDSSRIDADHLTTLITGLQQVATSVNTEAGLHQFATEAFVKSPGDLLLAYQNRVAVEQIPVMTLTFLMLGLSLFFLVQVVQVLIERQADIIAVLGSRGANQRQIAAVFATPCIGLALLALVLGPLLALVVARQLVQSLLPFANWDALSAITAHPWSSVWSVRWYVLAATGMVITTLLLTIAIAMRRDVLAFRRAVARPSSRALWQRFYLDGLAALVALTGYGYAAYVSATGTLDQRLAQLLIVPLTLITSVFFLVACTLFLLRFFPSLLRLGGRLGAQSRGVAPVLALAHTERVPQQTTRTTLLLSFTIAFALFALVFMATQAQRVQDVAAQQVGADFRGQLVVPQDSTQPPLNEQTAMYQALPGVTSATLGYQSDVTLNGSLPVQLQAVDIATYADTVIWTGQDSAQPLSTLIAQLAGLRQTATSAHVVPAMVDAALWRTLDLSVGEHFALRDTSELVQFVALAQVRQIPTIPGASLEDSAFPVGGLLVDYQTYADVFQQQSVSQSYERAIGLPSAGVAIPRNEIWLRTSNNEQSLAQVREEFAQGALNVAAFSDRRAIIRQLQNDPIFLALQGVFTFGAFASLLLALLGGMVASWQQARQRLTSRIILSALGTTPYQVALILLWEQGIAYAIALLLGSVLSAVMSALALPLLIFTSVTNNETSSGNFFRLQSVPPLHIVIPPSLGVILMVLAALSIGSVSIPLYLHTLREPAQTLRLDED